MMIGRASTNWPSMTAFSVKSKFKLPSGPFLVIKAYKIRPMATVGIARAVSLRRRKILRPLKS